MTKFHTHTYIRAKSVFTT